MKLLSVKKTKRDTQSQNDDKQLAHLKAQIAKNQAEKKLAESINDWDKEKEKKWAEFSKWNQEIQGRKAILIIEIEELEKKRDRLIDNLRAYNV